MESINLSAKKLFDYLYLKSSLQHPDAIIGFGHFDLKIPEQCAILYQQAVAPFIIFTGGVGAGSTGLTQPEAQVFFEYTRYRYPEIEPEKIIIEAASTNTGENILFTQNLLQEKYPELEFGKRLKKVALVANAYRQRRVYLTCLKHIPQIKLFNAPPETDFESEKKLFASKGENIFQHIVNEIKRLIQYPAKGFMAKDNIPEDILQAYQMLKQRL